MWLFTKHGFYSVVRSKGGPGYDIRARLKSHLDALIARFTVLAGSEILRLHHADYRWRIVVNHSTWVRIAGLLASEIDYSNFKGQVGKQLAEKPSEDGADYLAALHKVWQVMANVQAAEEQR